MAHWGLPLDTKCIQRSTVHTDFGALFTVSRSVPTEEMLSVHNISFKFNGKYDTVNTRENSPTWSRLYKDWDCTKSFLSKTLDVSKTVTFLISILHNFFPFQGPVYTTMFCFAFCRCFQMVLNGNVLKFQTILTTHCVDADLKGCDWLASLLRHFWEKAALSFVPLKSGHPTFVIALSAPFRSTFTIKAIVVSHWLLPTLIAITLSLYITSPDCSPWQR